MRPDIRHILMKRMHEDHRTYAGHITEYDHRMYDSRSSDYEDERRGVRGSGRRRRDMMGGEYYEDETEDYEHEQPLKLSRKARDHWLKGLMDKEGHRGPRFSKDEVFSVAEKMRIEYEDYSESDLYLMVNALYADYSCFRTLIPREKEIYYWVSAAKEWLEDDDSSLTGSEKVVAYYYFIVNG